MGFRLRWRHIKDYRQTSYEHKMHNTPQNDVSGYHQSLKQSIEKLKWQTKQNKSRSVCKCQNSGINIFKKAAYKDTSNNFRLQSSSAHEDNGLQYKNYK